MSATCVLWYVSRTNTGLSKHHNLVFPHFHRTWSMLGQGKGDMRMDSRLFRCSQMVSKSWCVPFGQTRTDFNALSMPFEST